MEQKLEIIENGQYKNINLKPKPTKGITGIEEGNHIVLKKTPYAEGMEKEGPYGKYYIVSAEYLGESVGFFLNAKEHEEYATAGGIDDEVKVSMGERRVTNKKTGATMLVPTLSFEKVEGV